MSSYPEDLKYSKSHEWVKVDGDVATIGITDYAQKELGEVVFVDLPEVGQVFDTEEEFGTIESVKAVSELNMPIAGEVLEHNPNLKDEPSAVNEDPHGEGWILRMKVASNADLDELMTSAEYEEYLKEEAKGH